ncbi:DUF2523 family protein [Comamonas thiooxydans]|uniref:DUF2523 family protein n=1 Tax=Comamonas thiooxydans TaxID=363952 RepID=UPI0005F7C463|nr:DUF2523 family protein [Comamonas thiooxydans]CUA99492.1 hypothetical protein Ga0061062_108145 [Comamonas thiooxydans]
MFGILLSALNSVLAWVFRSLLVKFALFFALYFITNEFVGFIAALLPNASSLNGTLSSITASTWFFLDAFHLPMGISALVSAYATRFIIRRMPVIG